VHLPVRAITASRQKYLHDSMNTQGFAPPVGGQVAWTAGRRIPTFA
jgi:hypothetical protein